MMLDTTDGNFLRELCGHIEKRVETLLTSILSQELGPKTSLYEKTAAMVMKDDVVRALKKLENVEKFAETAGFLDRKAME